MRFSRVNKLYLSLVMMLGNQPFSADIKSSQTSLRTVELVTAGRKHEI